MCRSCGRDYEDVGVRPCGPRTASMIPGMCVACVAEHFSGMGEGDPLEWWQCLPIETNDLVRVPGEREPGRVLAMEEDEAGKWPVGMPDGRTVRAYWDELEGAL